MTSSTLFTLLCLSFWCGCTCGLFNVIKVCDQRRGLTRSQMQMCNKYFEHMTYIMDGRRIALDECTKQFSGRRWNCTFPEPGIVPFLQPYMPLGTRETAFVHAIISAAAMHTISRACMENKLSSLCGCSQENRPNSLPREHMWKGCGDNLPYGYQFTKKFVDAKELNSENDDYPRVLMNLHNSEAGRWAVMEKSRIQCRCHGVSKNCATKTCYRQLARFKEIGKHLEHLHQAAVRVKTSSQLDKQAAKTNTRLVETNSEFNKFTTSDFVYLDDSPSYCSRDLDEGSFGTAGRRCSQPNNALNECSHLCCGRGHHLKRQLTKKKCGCQFVWCCEVKCKMCEQEENIRYCK